MTRLFTTTALIALTLAVPAANAASRATLTDEVKAQITAQLAEDGYEVRRVDVEDGLYEAYALKDGDRYEVYLDDDFAIVDIKMDD